MQEKTEVKGNLSEAEITKIANSRSYTYQLAWPIEIGTTSKTEVTLNRFKGKQIKAISKLKDSYDQGTKMIELSGNLSELEVDAMDVTDITNLMEICAVFMDASLLKKAPNTGN